MFNFSNAIYPQDPILSRLRASRGPATKSSPFSTQETVGEVTSQSQSTAGTTSPQLPISRNSSPSTPSAISAVSFTNSASTTSVAPSSDPSQSTPQTSQAFQGSNATTAVFLGFSSSQTTSGSSTTASSSSTHIVSNGGLPTNWNSSWSQTAGNDTLSRSQSFTASISRQLASISGSIIVPNNPIREHTFATMSATVTGSSAGASAT